MKPILIVAPFKEMYEMSLKICSKYDFVDVVLGWLDDAVEIVDASKNDGLEVLISRGGTMKRLAENFPDLDKVEIKISPYDILLALKKAKEFGKNIGVIGFKNIIEGIESLESILDIKINTYLVDNENEIIEAFMDAVSNKKVDVVLGGSLTERMATERGINTVFLQTNEISIEQSILEAKRLYDAKIKEREKAERFQSILNNTQEGIIATNKDGQIVIFNESAERITGLNKNDVLDKNISGVIKNYRIPEILKGDKPEYSKLETYQDKSLLINKVPVKINNQVTGMVATFDDVTKIQEYEQVIRSNLVKRGHIAKYKFNDIVGNGPSINKTKEKALKYSNNDSNILITGETGTGKEIFAQSIHNNSPRKNGPFIAINCAAISPTLIESELFGYYGGSFTGANKEGKQGLFTLAHTGTIFLDEIGEIPLELQSKLLRVLQEREVRPIGSDKVVPIDVRIISATNKSLLKEVKSGNFRRDLYYRINVLSLYLPLLKERQEDISMFCEYFIKKEIKNSGRTIKLSKGAIKELEEYHWPGNIRELQNAIQRMCILYDGETVSEVDIIDVLDEYTEHKTEVNPLKGVELEYISKVIKECNGNKTEAAKKLGISRTQLWRKINKY